MDAKTREQRRLNKIAAQRSARKMELRSDDFGAKFLGRANKPSERIENRRCDHVEGGKEIFLRRKRENPKPGQKETYMVRIIKGGLRCPNAALMGTKCLEHLNTGK